MKVNNPLITPQKVIDYIKENRLYSFRRGNVRNEYFGILHKYGYGNNYVSVEYFSSTLNQTQINKIYYELKQLK